MANLIQNFTPRNFEQGHDQKTVPYYGSCSNTNSKKLPPEDFWGDF